MAENEKDLPKVLKVSADLHRRLKRHAEKHGTVLEFQTAQWLERALREARQKDARQENPESVPLSGGDET